MAKRRANGEGALYQRPDGTWQARLSYVDPLSGARKRVSLYAATQQEVRDKMKTTRERLEAGSPPRDATRSVADWLSYWRTTTLAASDRKESSARTMSRCRARTWSQSRSAYSP